MINIKRQIEKKIDKELYSSGPYWNYKNRRAIIEIKKKGLKDFRGITAGIGTSFADNLVLDIRNEFNIKGRIVGKIFSLPLLNIIFNGQINTTKGYLNSFIKNQAIVYKNSQNVQNLISKFKFLLLILSFSLARINPVNASIALYKISCSFLTNLAFASSSPTIFF